MSSKSPRRLFDRRTFLKGAGVALAASAGTGLMPGFLRKALLPTGVGTASAADRPPDLFYAGTDGWISLPRTPAIGIFHPDSYAPDPFTTYIFGFRNVTGMTDHPAAGAEEQGAAPGADVLGDRGAGLPGPAHQPGPRPAPGPLRRAHPPLARVPQRHPLLRRGAHRVGLGASGEQLHVRLQAARGRDVHVPLPRRGHRARPHGHDRAGLRPPGARAQVRLQRPGHRLRPRVRDVPLGGLGGVALGGRAHPAPRVVRLQGRLRAAERQGLSRHARAQRLDRPVPPGLRRERRPRSARRKAGSPVPAALLARDLQRGRAGPPPLLQPGLQGGGDDARRDQDARGREGRDADARPRHRRRDGTDTSYVVNTVSFGAGESIDAIFTAPAHSGGVGPDVYVLYNRNFQRSNNLAPGGFGGQRTEVRVYPTGTLAPQVIPNT